VTEIGLQLHLIILPIAFAVSVLLTALGIFLAYRFGEGPEGFGGIFSFVFGGMAILGTLIGSLIAFIPYDSKYHVLYRASGDVDSVEATFNVDDGDITNNYLLRFEGDDNVYRLSDPRAGQLSGAVSLTCSIEWVYAGSDRINCVIAD
jgi:hypothetical protein